MRAVGCLNHLSVYDANRWGKAARRSPDGRLYSLRHERAFLARSPKTGKQIGEWSATKKQMVEAELCSMTARPNRHERLGRSGPTISTQSIGNWRASSIAIPTPLSRAEGLSPRVSQDKSSVYAVRPEEHACTCRRAGVQPGAGFTRPVLTCVIAGFHEQDGGARGVSEVRIVQRRALPLYVGYTADFRAQRGGRQVRIQAGRGTTPRKNSLEEMTLANPAIDRGSLLAACRAAVSHP